jgi:hypothetical protein
MHPVLSKMEILKLGISALKTGLNLHLTFEHGKKCRCQERKFEEPQICGLNGMEMELPIDIDSILLCIANSGSPKTFDFESSSTENLFNPQVEKQEQPTNPNAVT